MKNKSYEILSEWWPLPLLIVVLILLRLIA